MSPEERAKAIASRLSFEDSWPREEDLAWANGVVEKQIRQARADALEEAVKELIEHGLLRSANLLEHRAKAERGEG